MSTTPAVWLMQLNNQMSGVQAKTEREAAEDTILRLLDQRTSGWLIAESPPSGSLSLSFYLYMHDSIRHQYPNFSTISRELHFSWPKRALENFTFHGQNVLSKLIQNASFISRLHTHTHTHTQCACDSLFLISTRQPWSETSPSKYENSESSRTLFSVRFRDPVNPPQWSNYDQAPQAYWNGLAVHLCELLEPVKIVLEEFSTSCCAWQIWPGLCNAKSHSKSWHNRHREAWMRSPQQPPTRRSLTTALTLSSLCV
jgi:hypothetical protein